ncbi:glycosyltransferase [Gryllotalpicola ginsengisoli]|uniref:glycosyltransferase n=1 Tax=Gryllotalpicola ginsengisoli TaxID=444608 RepID=UPI0003B74FC5|nr:glycosyltransferase [Gryllotalpicola ginsengisoli]
MSARAQSKRREGVVSVVLVNFRGADDTITAVRGLHELDWPRERLEVIVVENASGDDSLERLTAEVGELARIVPSKENLGFAGGCNLGVAASTGEVVAFLNNDARPDAQWIRAAMAEFDAGRDIGAVASKVLDWEGADVDYVDSAITWYGMGYKPHAGERDRPEWSSPRDVLFGTGAAMFVRADVYEALGGFDERYFMFYEDVDLGWRLNLLGYRFRFVPASLAYHKHHASMSKFGDYHETYLLERNALFTLFKNLEDDELRQVLGAAALLAVRRATGRAGVDTEALDLRRADDDRLPDQKVSKQLLAGVYAIDRLVEELPGLAESRAKIQATRTRSDRELRALFGKTDEPAYPIDSYLAGYAKIVDALGVLEPAAPRGHVLIITGDAIGERMAGPAIRAWHMARVLSRENDVKLVSTTAAAPAAAEDERFEVLTVTHHQQSAMAELERWADVVVLQGHALALFGVLSQSAKKIVVDIYDPLHLEQLEQGRDLPRAQWDTQVAEANELLNHQLELGDFFLCASERQRSFWLGQLAAVGRINPYTYSRDNDLDDLLAVVPFGIPDEDPVRTGPGIRGAIPGIGPDDKVIVWGGGIYNWFDPETLVRAVAVVARTHPDVRLFFMGTQHPNPHVPQMRAATRAREVSRDLGLEDRHVFFNTSWVAYDERQNVLLDADLGVSTHFQHVETTYSFRTRILDYLWAGLPIVTTDGDSFADLVRAEGLGRVVPERDVDALAAALEEFLYDEGAREKAVRNVARVRSRFAWSTVLEPLAQFARHPRYAADRAPVAADSSKAARRAGRPRTRKVYYSGWRRDLQRVGYYLKNGGVGAVVARYRARVQRRGSGAA